MPSEFENTSETFNVFGQSGRLLTATVNRSGYDLSMQLAQNDLSSHKRLIGCAFLSFMPEEGLDETIETLAEYYDFHSSPKALPSGGTAVREHRGVIVEAEGDGIAVASQ